METIIPSKLSFNPSLNDLPQKAVSISPEVLSLSGGKKGNCYNTLWLRYGSAKALRVRVDQYPE